MKVTKPLSQAMLAFLMVGCASTESEVEKGITAAYQQLRACGNAAETAVRACVESLTSENLRPATTAKLAKWLYDLEAMGPLQPCARETLVSVPSAAKPSLAATRCFSFASFGRQADALIYFVHEAEKTKIDGIRLL